MAASTTKNTAFVLNFFQFSWASPLSKYVLYRYMIIYHSTVSDSIYACFSISFFCFLQNFSFLFVQIYNTLSFPQNKRLSTGFTQMFYPQTVFFVHLIIVLFCFPYNDETVDPLEYSDPSLSLLMLSQKAFEMELYILT